MASYDAVQLVLYTGGYDNGALTHAPASTIPLSVTFSDGESDTTFEFDDPETGFTTGQGVFKGSVEIALAAGGTMQLPVLVQSAQTYILIPTGYSATDFNFPATLNTSTFNTNPFPTCFLGGSLIATPEGEREVETLAIGDAVLTEDGRAVAVKWIGRQTVFTVFGPAERLMPVRFASGSLGEGLPHADLTVTADHGMLIDGVICHAGALVNGETITTVPLEEMGPSYTVYHIETEEHKIILANGAPAETFIDNVSRRSFDNFAEFEELYGDVPDMEELDYPRAMSARQVPPRIKAKLAGSKAA
jgi:hypothetical protein